MIQGELTNLKKLTEILDLPDHMVQERYSDILDEYGQALLWTRNMPLARRYYGELIRRRPSFKALMFWCASLLPEQVLNLKRRFSSPTPL